jgi:hypothetical protein
MNNFKFFQAIEISKLQKKLKFINNLHLKILKETIQKRILNYKKNLFKNFLKIKSSKIKKIYS